MPTSADCLTVMRHLADVAGLKGDPAAQRQLLVDGLNGLFRTTMGWLAVVDGCRVGHVPRLAIGVPAGHAAPAWAAYMAEFAAHVPLADDPYADHFRRCDDAEQQWTRRFVLPDPAARRRYAATIDVMTAARIGDGAVCGFRTGPGGHRVVAVSLHRCRDDPPMTDRDYALHRFAWAEVRRLAGRGHLDVTTPPAPPPPHLPPRLRPVLDRLLLGHAPKRIAVGLGLSLDTVREYAGDLYRLHGVSGRDELMARFIDRRG